jgi:molecular chaperone GrpE
MANAGRDASSPGSNGAEQHSAAPGASQGTPRAEGSAAAPTAEETIAALRAEAAELKDKLLRAHAEVENIRKRAERERDETAKYAISKLAREVVGVGDNFQRAIEAVPIGAAEQDPALKSFLDGVTMTERELLNVLERHGIKRIQPVNEPFNPHLHQAVMEIQRTDVPAGTIVQVFQAGFTIGDRVLRPAMVAVAKGGPRAQPAGDLGRGSPPSSAAPSDGDVQN